ncbi:GntR family transcriptional regulator [Algirhabdus cladophorae]|uniref:GntR family transcriptional regulator n=1 Tax=Algirhabdus cladophorae TaxID=3377108 RepID=UPI003B845E93
MLLETQERKTSADVVFDYLHEQINTLQLMPGTKISEAEIAAKFGVSRQPVRDAFSRLGNYDLLLIRPQKATVIKKFSLNAITAARFMRLSVELEVLRKALINWTPKWREKLMECIATQEDAVARGDADAFHKSDYTFHQLLCQVADAEFAFDIIQENKAKVDRLCVLSLGAKDTMPELLEDHKQMLDQLENGDEAGLCLTIRRHLSRLDSTVDDIYEKHADYFEAD